MLLVTDTSFLQASTSPLCSWADLLAADRYSTSAEVLVEPGLLGAAVLPSGT